MAEPVSRNAPCPCGSGKKYKNCCYERDAREQGARKRKRTLLAAGAGVALLVAVFLGAALYIRAQPGPYDDLARCLSQRGYKLYGASWCSHCAEQKSIFGKSFEYLDYVECSGPDGRGVNQTCKDAGIEKLPTWEAPEGEKTTGVLEPAELSVSSACPLAAARQ